MCQLDKIMEKRSLIRHLARKYKVNHIFVFGSCARKEETPDSDIDFLMEFDGQPSLDDHFNIQDELERIFHCKVDIVSKKWLHPLLKDRVLSEAVEI